MPKYFETGLSENHMEQTELKDKSQTESDFITIKTSRLKAGYFNFIFLLFGAENLLAVAAFATNSLYFKGRLSNSKNLEKFFEPSLILCSQIPYIFSNLFNIFMLNNVNEFILIIVPLAVTTVGFALTTIIIFVSMSDGLFFSLIMLFSFIMNFVAPIMQAAFYNQILYFPKSNLTFFLSGFPFSSVFVSVIQIIIISFNQSGKLTAIIYFSISVAFSFTCFILYWALTKTAEYKCGVKKFKHVSSNGSSEKDTKSNFKSNLKVYGKIFREKWIELLSMFLNFAITFSYWPTVILKIGSVNPTTQFGSKYFVIINCFLAFGVGDLIARNLIRFIKWPKYGSIWILILALIRGLFIFLFLLCNRPGVTNSAFPSVINHDVAPIIFVFIWTYLFGHLITLIFGVAYTYQDPAEIKSCNFLIVLCLGFGSSVGAFSSFGSALI